MLRESMSRTHNEPKYRRRIREKAGKDQQKAEAERQKAADSAKHYEIVRSIYAVVQEYQRYTNEERSRKQGDRYWEKAGVFGLWLAAAVGVAAIWFGTHDASEQRGQLKAQAEIMHNTLIMSQRPWLYVTGNITFGNIVQNPNPHNKIQDVVVSVDIINKGNSIAIGVDGGGQLEARQFSLDNRFSKIE